MCLDLLADSRFFSLLLDIDRELAASTRAAACSCGGRLYVANFARKPRGARGVLPDGYSRRLSFCCGREGCRRRATPPSVRFFGPKVYLAATVVLITTLRHGMTPVRLTALRALLGVEPATVRRWRVWWQTRFVASPLWRALRPAFSPELEVGALPASLLSSFAGTPAEQLVALLRCLAPGTTRAAHAGLAR